MLRCVVAFISMSVGLKLIEVLFPSPCVAEGIGERDLGCPVEHGFSLGDVRPHFFNVAFPTRAKDVWHVGAGSKFERGYDVEYGLGCAAADINEVHARLIVCGVFERDNGFEVRLREVHYMEVVS